MITNPTYIYRASVDRVIDGDTVILRIDLGCDVGVTKRVRLEGIDAPSVKTPEGIKSKEFLQSFVGSSEVIVETKKDRNDRYGRLLGQLYVAGESVNQSMVESGNAIVWNKV